MKWDGKRSNSFNVTYVRNWQIIKLIVNKSKKRLLRYGWRKMHFLLLKMSLLRQYG